MKSSCKSVAIFKIMGLGFVLLSLYGASARADDTVIATFSAGDGSEVDGFPGRAGNGWAGPWEIFQVHGSAPLQYSTASEPPMPGNTGKFLKMEFTCPEGNLPTDYLGGVLCRSLDDTYHDLDLAKPFEITFDFRPDSQQNAKDAFFFFQCPIKGNGTGLLDTWIIREQNSIWYWGEGDKAGGVKLTTSKMGVTPGSTYHFKIDVDPVAQTYEVSIGDGSDTVKSGPLDFRSSDPRNATYLCFGTGLNMGGSSVAMSLGSIEVKAIKKDSP